MSHSSLDESEILRALMPMITDIVDFISKAADAYCEELGDCCWEFPSCSYESVWIWERRTIDNVEGPIEVLIDVFEYRACRSHRIWMDLTGTITDTTKKGAEDE